MELALSPRTRIRARVAAVGAILVLGFCSVIDWSPAHRSESINVNPSDSDLDRVRTKGTAAELSTTSSARAVPADTIEALNHRWNAIWRADAAAADANVATLDVAATLVERALYGDLDATTDLIGAATWCIAGGPLVNVTEWDGNRMKPCYERFGDALASRDALERAVLGWALQLAAAGLDDAALYASALLRGNGNRLFDDHHNGHDVGAQEQQKAQLLGHLQGLAARGSADAASELHGHWSGESSLLLGDPALANYYAALTHRLDPTRELLATPK